MKIGALVLAAGQSKRFGGDKRQATLPSGKLVIHQTLEKVTAAFEDVIVVLRAEDSELHENLLYLFPHLTYHHAADSELGMGHSLASGIRQIDRWDGVFVFLADMPFVDARSLRSLRSVEMRGKIVVPTYQNKPGHPVGFSSEYFEELRQLSGDRGAKTIIKRHLGSIVVLPVIDPGVLQDIDRQADINAD